MSEKHKGPHCDGHCEGTAYNNEIRRLRAELEEMRSSAIYWQDRCGELEKTFSHTHKNSGDGTDTCATCGRDLRDPIHTMLAAAKEES